MSGMTVTPSIQVNPETGEEFISYEEASVVSTSGKEQALEEFHRAQSEYYYEDEEGQIHHYYSEVDDPELLYDEYLDDYSEEHDYDAELTESDAEYIKDSVGGEEAYGNLLSWAAENMPEDFIENFDGVMGTGDVESMLEAVRNLYEIYMEGDYEQEYDEDDYDDEPLDSGLSAFVESVYEGFGSREDYEAAISWAGRSWPQSRIETFDRAIDSDSTELMQQALDILYSDYFNNN